MSPMYMQKNTFSEPCVYIYICTHKTAIWAICVRKITHLASYMHTCICNHKRAICIRKRALYIRKNEHLAIYIHIYLLTKYTYVYIHSPYVCIYIYSFFCGYALCIRRRTHMANYMYTYICTHKTDICIRKRALYICQNPH